MSSPEAVDTYRAFLALEPEEQRDPLEEDARRRHRRPLTGGEIQIADAGASEPGEMELGASLSP